MEENSQGIILVLTFIIPIIIALIFQYRMYSIRKKDKKIIESDWRDFKKAVERNDILYISKIGTQLVWNKSMTVKRLKIMSKELEKFPTNIEEIEKLRLLIFNKKLHWERKSV